MLGDKPREGTRWVSPGARRQALAAALSRPDLAIRTCLGRLAPLGVWPEGPVVSDGGSASSRLAPCGRRPGGRPASVEVNVSWHGPAGFPAERPASEATIQAQTGLMTLHGRDLGRPRRMGLELASVAAGVLAAQGALAALIARSRGQVAPELLNTSVLQAGLLQASHYVAAATCGVEWVPAPPGPAPGPPFLTADGRRFEIETLDPEVWRSFWEKLGAQGADLGWAWTLFRPRYYRGTCTLPVGFHEATASHTLAEVTAIAEDCGVSLVPIRSYGEVLLEPGLSEGLPGVEDHAAQARTARASILAPRPLYPGDLPLQGMLVVEATSRLQGPLAGLLLKMLGAEVVRVEPPGGDIGRGVPPLAGDTGSFFLCFNRGKQAVELDLTRAEGRAELVQLTKKADVFLQNWRPGKAGQWGLDVDDLAWHNPRLVYAQASGWGEGRAHQLLGTDFLVQAYAGLGEGLNPAGEPPSPSRVLLTDFMGALVACEGVLAGLYRRETTGRGCRVHTSLLAGAMTLQAHVLRALAEGREEGRRQGRPLWRPLYQPIQTSDGYVALDLGDDAAALRGLCELCGVDPQGDLEGIENRLAAELSTASSAQCEEELTGVGIPAAGVCTRLEELPADHRLAHLFEPLDGGSSAPASPWRFG